MSIFRIAALALIVVQEPVLADPFEDGVIAYALGDYEEAFALWRPLAQLGHSAAQTNLGNMYADGSGVDKDTAKAIEWYLRAAGQAHPGALYNLGIVFEAGDGVDRNLVKAYMWFTLAAGLAAAGAETARDNVASIMTPAEIAKAELLAREWVENRAGD